LRSWTAPPSPLSRPMTDFLRLAEDTIVRLSGVAAWRDDFLYGLGTLAVIVFLVGLVVWVSRS
jgi:hypothetical protein